MFEKAQVATSKYFLNYRLDLRKSLKHMMSLKISQFLGIKVGMSEMIRN